MIDRAVAAARTPRPHARSLVLCVLTLAVSAVASAAAAQPARVAADPIVARIDAELASAYPAGGPGAAAIVVRDGKPILRKGYGMANVELGVPIAPDTVFRLGSMTKQ